MATEIANASEVLTFELKNVRPVELTDYTLAMLSLAKEFSRFASPGEDRPDAPEIKLYINQIRQGSILADLVANSPTMFPVFLEGAKALKEYSGYLKSAYEFFLGKKDDKPIVLEKKTLENLSQIIEPVCKDAGSQLNISTTTNNYGPVVHLTMNYLEANAAQNKIRGQLEQMKEPLTGEHRKVVMRMFQARDDANSRSGDRAIVESLARGSVRVTFADDKMKAQVLHPSSGNIFDYYYIADVLVETVNGKPALYNVTHIHESIEQASI